MRVYVANRGSNTISVIDSFTDQLIATIPEGGVPNSVAINPATNRIYVTNLIRTVSVIDGGTNQIVATIPVGASPFSIAVNPETNRVYVANFYDASVSVIDGATNTVLTSVAVGGQPSGVAVNTRTNRVYVSNYQSGNVAVIDGGTNAIVGVAQTGGSPGGVAVNSNTNVIYVATSPTLTIVDGSTNGIVAVLDQEYADQIAVNQVLNRAYVTRIGVNKVAVIDGQTHAEAGLIDLGTFLAGIDVNPVNNKIYVAEYFANAVAVIASADATPPTITASITPAPNAAGWNNESVTVSWTLSDPESGIATSSGCSTGTLMNSTEGTVVTCTATNGDGLSGHASVTLKIDKTPPTITAATTTVDGNVYRLGNWTNQAVAVRYTCTDPRLPSIASSGLATCSSPETFGTEGVVSTTGSATDVAGNSRNLAVGPIRIDTTAPTIVATATTADGRRYVEGTWTSQFVTVHYVCSDSLSGTFSCPSDHVFGDGTVTATSGTAVDFAQNSATATFGPIRVDRVPPSITALVTTADGAPYVAGSWTTQAVRVRYSCSDVGSGIASCPDAQAFDGDQVDTLATGTTTDNVGLWTTTSFGPIRIDRVAPNISASATTSTGDAYTSGSWTNQSVTVRYTCSDSVSGIASCPDDQNFETEGTWTATGTTTDNAGNVGSAGFGPILIDLTPPSISFAGNAGSYEVDQLVSITCAATDGGSGIRLTSCPAVSSLLAADYVGTDKTTNVTLTATASDNAGNLSSADTTFTVTVTSDGICRLTASLRNATALCEQVRAINGAPNATAKVGQLRGFDHFLAAQPDVSPDLAATLRRLARAV